MAGYPRTVDFAVPLLRSSSTVPRRRSWRALVRRGCRPRPPTVKVWFLQGEQMISVDRPGTTAQDAITQLLVGPTAAEAKRGYETYVPQGTTINGVTVANGIATVDLGLEFVQGRDGSSLLARLSQVVHTATGPGRGDEGAAAGQGRHSDRDVPRGVRRRPDHREVPRDAERLRAEAADRGAACRWSTACARRSSGSSSSAISCRRDVDGQAGPATQSAVLAFQKWEGLDRDGALGPQTLKRLQTAKRPDAAHPPRRRQARRGAARPSGRPRDRERQGRARDPRLDRGIARRRRRRATSRSTPRSRSGGRCRSASGCSGPCRSTAASRSTSSPRCPPYPASHGCVRETVRQLEVDVRLLAGRHARQGDHELPMMRRLLIVAAVVPRSPQPAPAAPPRPDDSRPAR